MSAAVFTAVLLGLFLSYTFLRGKKKSHAYPPEPRSKPIIGHALDIPLKKPWLKFLEWSKELDSDIIHLRALNKHFVILNKLEDVQEIMDKRSRKYSSRPANPIAEMLDIKTFTPFIPYGEALKKQRRFFDESLKKEAVHSYRHVLEEKVHLLLDDLVRDPAEFDKHCNMLGTAINLATTFGYDCVPGKKDDDFVEKGYYALTSLSELALPGRNLILAFPFLRHIPPWFPGASTQKFAATAREAFKHYKAGSLAYVKNNMASGTAKDSVFRRLLERSRSGDGFSVDPIVMDAGYALYLGAVEVPGIFLSTFLLAMTLHPMIQKKAQVEIDRVIGHDRLPKYEDRPSMPIVEAIYREILRWRPLAPVAFPHSSDEDDVYKGYYIPKDTIVVPNVWAITRNEQVYSDPEAFNPERFLKDDGTLNDDNVSYTFGFGRRICPGKYVSELLLWLTVVSILAVFDISKARDEDGKEIEITADLDAFTDAALSRPKPYKCSIVPRSAQIKTIVENTAEPILQTLRGL